MWTSPIDASVTDSISLDAVRKFAIAKGWKRSEQANPRLELFTTFVENQLCFLPVPKEEYASDFQQVLRDAVDILASHDGISSFSLAARIIRLNHDVMDITSPVQLNFDQSSELMNRLKAVLEESALETAQRLKFSSPKSAASKFITEGIVDYSAFPRFTSIRWALSRSYGVETPFARHVLLDLNSTLSALRDASGNAQSLFSMTHPKTALKLLRLFKAVPAAPMLSFNFEQTPLSENETEVLSDLTLDAEKLLLLEDQVAMVAESASTDVDLSKPIELTGTIQSLTRKGTHRYGQILVRCELPWRNIVTVRCDVDRKNYEKAFSIDLRGGIVKISGMLEKIKTRWHMTDCESVESEF
jgi:hypothetical protein